MRGTPIISPRGDSQTRGTNGLPAADLLEREETRLCVRTTRALHPVGLSQNPAAIGDHRSADLPRERRIDLVVSVGTTITAAPEHESQTLERGRIQVCHQSIDHRDMGRSTFSKRQPLLDDQSPTAVERCVIGTACGVPPIHLAPTVRQLLRSFQNLSSRYRHRPCPQTLRKTHSSRRSTTPCARPSLPPSASSSRTPFPACNVRRDHRESHPD